MPRGEVPQLKIYKLVRKNYEYKYHITKHCLFCSIAPSSSQTGFLFLKRRHKHTNRTAAGFAPHRQIVRATTYTFATEMVIKKPDVKRRYNWKKKTWMSLKTH
jgi:hypothetical protein